MILLTTTEKLNIVVENEDLMKGNKNFKILCQQRIYDGNTYACISDPTKFNLYKNIIADYEAHKPEAEAEFDRQFEMFKKSEPQPEPQPEPQQQENEPNSAANDVQAALFGNKYLFGKETGI